MSVLLSRALGSSVLAPHVSGLSRSASYTQAITVKPTKALSVASQAWTFMAKGPWGATNYTLDWWNDSGTNKLRCGFTDTGDVDRQLSVAYVMLPGSTHRIASSWNDSTKLLSLFSVTRRTGGVNGSAALTLLGSTTFGGVSPKTNSTALSFGSQSVATSANATLSEAVLYDADISKATMDGYLSKRLTGYETNTVSYWPLADGCGMKGTLIAYDTKGVSNGNLTSGAKWGSEPEDLPYPTGLFDSAAIGIHDLGRLIDASVSASSADSNYPVGRLYSEKCSWRTRTADATVLRHYTWDLGARASSVSMVALRGHNLTSGATILLEGHTDTSQWGSSPAYSSSVTFHKDYIYHFLDRPRNLRYWRVSLTDTSLSYIELGAFELWHCWDPGRSPNEFTSSIVDMSDSTAAKYGREVPRNLTKRRMMSVGWYDLPKDQADELNRLMSLSSKGGTIFLMSARRNLYSQGFVGHFKSIPSTSLSVRSGEHKSGAKLTVVEDVLV